MGPTLPRKIRAIGLNVSALEPVKVAKSGFFTAVRETLQSCTSFLTNLLLFQRLSLCLTLKVNTSGIRKR